MTTPEAVLAEIRSRGAIAYRRGDTIRLRPASILPAELVEAVRRHKPELLRLVPERPPEDASTCTDVAVPPSSPPAWQLIVESRHPRPGPIQLNPWTLIVDPTTCIAARLADLQMAVAAKNAGREHSMLVALIDEYVTTLKVCGATVRVQVTQ